MHFKSIYRRPLIGQKSRQNRANTELKASYNRATLKVVYTGGVSSNCNSTSFYHYYCSLVRYTLSLVDDRYHVTVKWYNRKACYCDHFLMEEAVFTIYNQTDARLRNLQVLDHVVYSAVSASRGFRGFLITGIPYNILVQFLV